MTAQVELVDHQRVRAGFFKREDTWTIMLNGEKRTVMAEMNGLSGKVQIYVDNHFVYEPSWLKVYRFSHNFSIDAFPATIIYYLNNDIIVPHLNLIVDHTNVETGQYVSKTTLPVWSWLFALTCFIIPILTIGGALPSLIGMGGGVYVLATANRRSESEWVRIAKMVGIILITWLVFLMFIYAFSPELREAFALGMREGMQGTSR